MDRDQAVTLLTDAILDSGSLATLTTAPTLKQREAMRSVDRAAQAPSDVCDEMELEAGCTWKQVLEVVHGDAAFG